MSRWDIQIDCISVGFVCGAFGAGTCVSYTERQDPYYACVVMFRSLLQKSGASCGACNSARFQGFFCSHFSISSGGAGALQGPNNHDRRDLLVLIVQVIRNCERQTATQGTRTEVHRDSPRAEKILSSNHITSLRRGGGVRALGGPEVT